MITDGEAGFFTNSYSSKQCACLQNGTNGTCLQWAYQATYTGFGYQEPDGTNHRTLKNVKLQTACGGNTISGTFWAADNSGYKFVVSSSAANFATVYAADGTQVYPALQDTNGNYFNASASNVVDTLGRIPVVATSSGNQVFLDYLCVPVFRIKVRRWAFPESPRNARSFPRSQPLRQSARRDWDGGRSSAHGYVSGAAPRCHRRQAHKAGRLGFFRH